MAFCKEKSVQKEDKKALLHQSVFVSKKRTCYIEKRMQEGCPMGEVETDKDERRVKTCCNINK